MNCIYIGRSAYRRSRVGNFTYYSRLIHSYYRVFSRTADSHELANIRQNSVNKLFKMQIKPKTNIVELFEDARRQQTYLKICAPMVRYSKLEFRTLVRKYGVDLCYTPMIMTDSFCRSLKARHNEFSTNVGDTPVIAQFAAKDNIEYLSAAEMVYPYVDGVDLNCGCPQHWAMSSGFGSALLYKPETIHDMTSTLRRNFPSDFSISVKIRVQKPLSTTIELVRQLEKCGVTFLTVHGRTPSQRTKELSNTDFLREIKQSMSIPMVANGDCKSLDDANRMFEKIDCDGVMAARGILANPTLFSGEYETTPLQCVQNWVDLAFEADTRITFQCFHHHLTFMMEKLLRRRDRVVFNSFSKKEQVFQFLREKLDIVPNAAKEAHMLTCDYNESKYKERVQVQEAEEEAKRYNSENSRGKFFLGKLNGDGSADDDSDCEENGLNCLFG